jgi:hypothetical protein
MPCEDASLDLLWDVGGTMIDRSTEILTLNELQRRIHPTSPDVSIIDPLYEPIKCNLIPTMPLNCSRQVAIIKLWTICRDQRAFTGPELTDQLGASPDL